MRGVLGVCRVRGSVGVGSMKSAFAFVCLCAAALPGGWLLEGPPDTKKIPVAEAYHGESVVEDYRWLEDQTQPEVKQWMKDQNLHSREFLDALPGRKEIRQKLTGML